MPKLKKEPIYFIGEILDTEGNVTGTKILKAPSKTVAISHMVKNAVTVRKASTGEVVAALDYGVPIENLMPSKASAPSAAATAAVE